MGIGVTLSGTGCALLHGNVEPLIAVLCVLFALFTQMAGNVLYHYFQQKNYLELKKKNEMLPPVNVDMTMQPLLPNIAQMLAIFAAMCGLAIVGMSYWWAIGVGLVVFALSYLSVTCVKFLADTPLHLILTFLLFGPVAVISTSLVQTASGAEGNILNWFDMAPSVYMCMIAGLMCMDVDLLRIYQGNAEPLSLLMRPAKERMSRATARLMLLCSGIIEMVLGIAVAVLIATNDADTAWWIASLVGGIGSLAMNLPVIMKLPAKGEKVPGYQFKLLYFKIIIGALMVITVFSILGLPNDSPFNTPFN